MHAATPASSLVPRFVLLLATATATAMAMAMATACGGAPAAEPTTAGTAAGSSLAEPPRSEGRAAPGPALGGAGNGTSSLLTHAPSPEVSRGVRAFDAGDLVAARAAFAAAEAKDPKDADAAFYAGAVADRQGDARGAETHLRRALALSPGHAAAAAELAVIEEEAGHNDEAAALCRDALRQHPNDVALHENLGVALAGKGDEAGATRELEAAVELDPEQPMLFLTYGHWLTIWKKPAEAVAKLKTARTLAGSDRGTLAGIAQELGQAGAFAECIGALDEAVALGDAAELRMDRALCRLGAKDETGARADLEAAVKNEPHFAPTHFLLGMRLAKAGEKARAISELEAYVKLEPGTPNAKVARDRIEVLKKAK